MNGDHDAREQLGELWLLVGFVFFLAGKPNSMGFWMLSQAELEAFVATALVTVEFRTLGSKTSSKRIEQKTCHCLTSGAKRPRQRPASDVRSIGALASCGATEPTGCHHETRRVHTHARSKAHSIERSHSDFLLPPSNIVFPAA